MYCKKHILLIIFSLLSWSAVYAQLAVSPSEWNFGVIEEAKGPVSHTFTGVNRSDKPLVILDVVTSCGCTRPQFSRQPILPGEKTQITVTYDPANRPGVFSRELAIYSSDRRKVATLTVRGSVTPRPKSIEELYPVDAGGGLRLNSTLCTFSYIYLGRRVLSSVGYVNTSDKAITLELLPQQSSGMLKVEYPRSIAPGAQGEINLAYLSPAESPRYGTLRDALELRVGGRSNGTLLVAHAIGVDADDNGENPSAPKLELSENMIKFGAVKYAGGIRRLPLRLTNAGGEELIVRAVENGGVFATTLTPGLRIPAGESATVDVMLNPREQDYGIVSDHLIVITNDPTRPMRRLRVVAIIEE